MIVLTSFVVLLAGSSLIALVEPAVDGSNIKTGGDAFWWAFVTITTVGYGDRFPVTPTGRFVGMVTMAVGIGIFGVLTSYLSSLFLAKDDEAPATTRSDPGRRAGPAPGRAGRAARRDGRSAPAPGGAATWMTSRPAPVRPRIPLVPGWLVRLAAIGWRVLVTLALGVVLFGIAVQLSTVVWSIILALILAATLAPFVSERRARGASRAKAAGIVSLRAVLVFGARHRRIVIVLAPSVTAIVTAFDSGIGTVRDQLTGLGVSADLTAVLERISTRSAHPS